MTPINSESIKTFKEEVATLNKKNNFDVADCDNVYGGLESIISQFEMTENDPVRNNIELQTLERLLKSLEHIRSEMLESDPSSYTLEISGLLKDLYETLVLIESDLDTKKLRITVPKLTSYLIELEKHMVIDVEYKNRLMDDRAKMRRIFSSFLNFKKELSSPEFSKLQIAQVFKTLSEQEQIDYYNKLKALGENIGYLGVPRSPEKKPLDKKSFLNLSPIDQLKLISNEFSTIPSEVVAELLSELIPDDVSETPKEIEKDRKYNLKISQLEYFTYILEAKRDEFTRASGYLNYKLNERTSEKNVWEGYKFLGMTQEEIGKARIKKTEIDDFLDPISYNEGNSSDPDAKLRGIDTIMASLKENPDLSLKQVLKDNHYGHLIQYLDEFKVDFESIKTEEDLEKFKFPVMDHLDGLKSYDLVREIGYADIKDDLDAYSKEKNLFKVSTYIDVDTHQGYARGGVEVDPEMVGHNLQNIAANEKPVNQIYWKRAYQNVMGEGGDGLGKYGIAKLANQVFQKFNEMQVALGRELTKPDGTPFTRQDAEAVALATANKIVYKEHERLRYKDILEKMYEDKNVKISPDKSRTFEYLYKYEGFGIQNIKPETQDFLVDFTHEVAITLASMFAGVGAVNLLTKVAKAGSALSKVGRLAKVAKFFNNHKRITAISSAVGRNFTEALIFESTYNLAHGQNLFHKDRWFWDVCWTALTFGALKGVGALTQTTSKAVSASLIRRTPKLVKLINKVPKAAQNIVENWIISGNVEAITLLLIGAVEKGIITINWKSDNLLAELKAYGLNFNDELEEKFWQTYATMIGLKGGSEAAKKLSPKKEVKQRVKLKKPGKRGSIERNLERQKNKPSGPSESAIKKALNFESLFKLFPKNTDFQRILKKAGLNLQWLEASLMDIKDPIKRYNAIKKIFEIISTETVNGKKLDPKKLLERLKTSNDVAETTALEILFISGKFKGLKFSSEKLEELFNNKNTSFIAGEFLLENMNRPEFVKKLGTYLETKLPAIETQLRSFFAKALNGMEMTKEELLKVSKYVENNPILKMIDVLASTGGIKKLIMETKVGKVLTTGITGTLTLLYAQTAQAGTLGFTIAETALKAGGTALWTIFPTVGVINVLYGLFKGARLRNEAANKGNIATHSADMKKTLSDNEAAFRSVFGDKAFDEMMALQGQIGTGEFINIPYFGQVPKLDIKNFREIKGTKSDRTTVVGRLGLLRLVEKKSRPEFQKHSEQLNADLKAFVEALTELAKNSENEIQKKEANRLFKMLTGEVKVEISKEVGDEIAKLEELMPKLESSPSTATARKAFEQTENDFKKVGLKVSGRDPTLTADFKALKTAIDNVRNNPTQDNIDARDTAYRKLLTDIDIIKGTTSTIPGSVRQVLGDFDPNMSNVERSMLVDQLLEAGWHMLRNDPILRRNFTKGEYYFHEIEKLLREAAAKTNPGDKVGAGTKIMNFLTKYVGAQLGKRILLVFAIAFVLAYSYNEYDSEENILQRAQKGDFDSDVNTIRMSLTEDEDTAYFADQKGFEKFLKENPGTEAAIAYDKLDRGNKKIFFKHFKIAPPPPANKDTNNEGQGKGQNEGVKTNVEVVPKMDLAGLEGLYGTNITSSPVVKKYSELPSDAVSDFTKLNEVIMKYCEALKNNLRSEEVDKWFNVYFEDPKVKEMLLNKISEKLDTL